jgi:hypothetical protein
VSRVDYANMLQMVDREQIPHEIERKVLKRTGVLIALVPKELFYLFLDSHLYSQLAHAVWACNEPLLKFGATRSICNSY